MGHESNAAPVMVIADNRQIAEAGLRVLLAGGSAADAAVAALMVTSVVAPQAAGIGGGAVLVHFDAATHSVTAWDGRETAPAAAIPSGPTEPRRSGGRAVGVPGAIRMLEALHRERGHLPWADLVAPAIHLAEQGAPVSLDLANAIAAEQDWLRRQPAALGVFFAADGTPLLPGAMLTNPLLAQTLRAIATGGANGLLRGPVAAEIATAARGDERAGLLTTDDLAAYVPRHRDATCAPYRWGSVCSTPPPAGGLLLLQMLGLLDHTDLAALDPDGIDAASLLIEAEQLAAADGAQYLADPEFVPVPVAGLLAEPYLAMRAQLIDRLHAIRAEPGLPPVGKSAVKPQLEHGTSSIAIIDAQGNAIAMTATLGESFGSHVFVRGFLLNAALAHFSATPADPAETAAANQIQPGKRPATALAPAIVLDGEHRLVAVIGSTGGSRIPGYEAQALAGLLAWHMDAAHAIAQPHVAGDPDSAVLEADTAAAALAPALTERGFAAAPAAMPSRTVLFALVPQSAPGAADPRGQGEVAAK